MQKVMVAAIVAMATCGLLGAPAAAEEKGGYVVVGAGSHDFTQGDGDHAAEFRLEYRDGPIFWHIRPFAGLSVTTSGTVWGGIGLVLDLMLTDHLFLAASVGPGFFVGNDNELGFPLEFRSQLEVGWRFTGGQRLAIAFSHTSNAGLADHNEGANALVLQFHQPVASLLGD